jgi:hypothetical protein
MVYNYSPNEIAQQIERLPAYPQVGPLAPEAVAINLGASLDAIQEVLDSCLVSPTPDRAARGPRHAYGR